MIATDYTQQNNPNTLDVGYLQGYRFMHWLADILRNFMSDPINIKDERLCRLLSLQDGATDTQLNALFDIGTPYSTDTTKACTTPMILISLGELHDVRPSAFSSMTPITSSSNVLGSVSLIQRTISCDVSVQTESYDGTVLLGGMLEDFLVMNSTNFLRDNKTLATFTCHGITAPSHIKLGTDVHAKDIYQAVIKIVVTGSIKCTTDTRGPVFKGISLVSSVT